MIRNPNSTSYTHPVQGGDFKQTVYLPGFQFICITLEIAVITEFHITRVIHTVKGYPIHTLHEPVLYFNAASQIFLHDGTYVSVVSIKPYFYHPAPPHFNGSLLASLILLQYPSNSLSLYLGDFHVC